MASHVNMGALDIGADAPLSSVKSLLVASESDGSQDYRRGVHHWRVTAIALGDERTLTPRTLTVELRRRLQRVNTARFMRSHPHEDRTVTSSPDRASPRPCSATREKTFPISETAQRAVR